MDYSSGGNYLTQRLQFYLSGLFLFMYIARRCSTPFNFNRANYSPSPKLCSDPDDPSDTWIAQFRMQTGRNKLDNS